MLKKLETALGYTYRNQELLTMALSHSSYANERFQNSLYSYERLEFLGDSILGYKSHMGAALLRRIIFIRPFRTSTRES